MSVADMAGLCHEGAAMQEVKITFLGTGTSHGIPVIGCQCSVCGSVDPRDKRLRSSIQVRTSEMIIQVDTPPDFRTQCLREAVTRIDAVVYTHSHTDHILGFDDLRRFCEMENKSMPIYAAAGTLNDLRRVFRYAFEGQYRFHGYIRPEPVIIDGPFRLGETEVVPFDLPHGRTVTTGLVFRRKGRNVLAYFTDCKEVTKDAAEASRGVDILVVDALRHASHPTHMSLAEATATSQRIGAQMTYFTHMCHDLGHAETESMLPSNIRLAYDGLVLTL
ncbi:MAG TPA: MBL fold metallo-hydrolase [Terrimicrobiaceae bacterium]|nr:MBL fold metallo-hydrolase [Terrimicrobiaceae bacterium]